VTVCVKEHGNIHVVYKSAVINMVMVANYELYSTNLIYGKNESIYNNTCMYVLCTCNVFLYFKKEYAAATATTTAAAAAVIILCK
jgi:hypothetical protein